MTLTEELDWGRREYQARLADIANVKAGAITLEQAQAAARHRSRRSGMTPSRAYQAMTEASREARRLR